MSNDTITTVSPRITLTQVSDSILALCKMEKVDVVQLKNAVDSALARMSHEDSTDKAVITWKAATKKVAETFKLTERQVNKFIMRGNDPGLRFYLWNQEVMALEQRVGAMEFASFPTYLQSWIEKFISKAPAPGTPNFVGPVKS